MEENLAGFLIRLEATAPVDVTKKLEMTSSAISS
jgi:hypothetical protein